jgi:hypothetical protein
VTGVQTCALPISYKSWQDLNDDKVTLVQVRGTTPVAWI